MKHWLLVLLGAGLGAYTTIWAIRLYIVVKLLYARPRLDAAAAEPIEALDRRQSSSCVAGAAGPAISRLNQRG